MPTFIAVALFLVALLAPPAANSNSLLHVTACTEGKSKLRSHCGTLRIYENRATRSGRTIELHFIEIDAQHPTNRAIFFNPGGPGAGELDDAPAIADGQFLKALQKLQSSYNLVFIDNRGTGRSHPLQCDVDPKARPEYAFRQLWPDALLRACREALSKTSDLNQYTTDISVADVDDVRAALQYPKIVLYGGSYGTALYLDYARRYPAHVESLVLDGVAPPGILIVPLEDAQGGQKAIDQLSADCSHDRVCHAHFPQFAAHFDAVAQRLRGGPLPVPILNPATKRHETVLLYKEVFDDRMRDMLYADEGAAYVPYIIEQAYDENYEPLGRAIAAMTDWMDSTVATGLNLSATCAEDIPFITESDIAKTSAGSFIGDSRVRAQQHACAIWNVNHAAADFATPVRSDAPILMLSGSADPASPPQYGALALRYLPNGRQILIPHASHETELDCEDDLVVTFVHTRNAKSLDASKCIGTSQRPPFALSMNGFP